MKSAWESGVRTRRLLWVSLWSLSHRVPALDFVAAATCLELVLFFFFFLIFYLPLLNVLFTLAFMPLSRSSIIFCVAEQRIMIMFV